MARQRVLSPGLVAVLEAIGSGYSYGFDIMDYTKLPSGTVYPALSRLQQLGFARSDWEPQEIAASEKRPPRRYYSITAAGRRALLQAADYYRALGERLPVRPDGVEPSRA